MNDDIYILAKQRLKSKGWMLGASVVLLGFAADNLVLVQDLLKDHYGMVLMTIGGLKIVVRELTKTSLSEK